MSYSESVIKSFFTNDLEVSEYDYRPTYTLFRVKAVDGVPVHAKILLSFYNEKEYCPAHTRENYQGSLNVFIKGNLFEGCDTEQCIGSRSVPFSKKQFANRTPVDFAEFILPACGKYFHRYNKVCGCMKNHPDPSFARKQRDIYLGRL